MFSLKTFQLQNLRSDGSLCEQNPAGPFGDFRSFQVAQILRHLWPGQKWRWTRSWDVQKFEGKSSFFVLLNYFRNYYYFYFIYFSILLISANNRPEKYRFTTRNQSIFHSGRSFYFWKEWKLRNSERINFSLVFGHFREESAQAGHSGDQRFYKK